MPTGNRFSLFISMLVFAAFRAYSPAKLRFYSETGKGSKGKNLERIGEGANGPFLLPNWRDFATQLGSNFFPVGASIRSISLAAGFILSSDAVFTCDSPNRGSYGNMPPRWVESPPSPRKGGIVSCRGVEYRRILIAEMVSDGTTIMNTLSFRA